MSTILVIDDEPGIRSVLKDVLEDEEYRVLLSEDGIAGLAMLNKEPVDLVILDVWLPNMGGIEVLEKIKENFPAIEVVIISGHANINMAVKAVKMGAFDFLEKPLSLEKTITVVQNALKYEALKKENRSLKESLFMEDEMIGSSLGMQEIWDVIRHSAPSDSRILILGENGTGKELVAREIHRNSRRSDGPFIEVNCAAIPENLIESELFGHEKGAFTDAVNMRKGKFELAHKGTLFLDEIADMSLTTQAKVLRAIQELKFERIGGEKSIEVDVRILSATNKNLEEEVKAGRFREDLFFRLNVIPIHVPPLRERVEDIALLAVYFMKKYKRHQDQTEKYFTPEGLKAMEEYPWPGNIRELKNVVERINIMVDSDAITPGILKEYLKQTDRNTEDNDLLGEFGKMSLSEAKTQFEKDLIIRKLEETGYNITKAAESLGVYPSNLHSKIKKYGIETKK